MSRGERRPADSLSAPVDYPYGFSSDFETERFPAGLNEEILRRISACKEEPEWLLQWRLEAFAAWQQMKPPAWAELDIAPINFQDICYFAAPKRRNLQSLEELDPATRETFERLGIPLQEQKRLAGVAMDLVVDSSSVATSFSAELTARGIIFCSFSEAVKRYPDLVRQYLGRVVPSRDNYFAALNSAVFSDGSFCYIPAGVRCPLELSTYFRINSAGTGQFERTLIIAEEGSYVSYLEGCTAPMREEHQLHAAVVEIYAAAGAEVRYATIQNWYPGDAAGKGGVYNFVTKRALCAGEASKVSWVQVETGSSITWKYPSCVLQGVGSQGHFYSFALTRHRQQADTGTKMIHLAPHTRSRIVAKGVAAGASRNTYRGLVHMAAGALHARNHSQCDSLLLSDQCAAYTYPYIEIREATAVVEHEATTSRLAEEQLFYCMQRGMSEEEAVALLVLGSGQEVLSELPFEFAAEARRLLSMQLVGCVG